MQRDAQEKVSEVTGDIVVSFFFFFFSTSACLFIHIHTSSPSLQWKRLFYSLPLSSKKSQTHIFSLQRLWRATVVSQKLCNLLPQAEREQFREVTWGGGVWLQLTVWDLLTREACSLVQLKFRCSLISYNWCPLQSGYCSSGRSSCSMSGLVSCVRKQNGSHLRTRRESFAPNYARQSFPSDTIQCGLWL